MLSDNLPNNEAHVYYALLSETELRSDHLLPLLDAAERAQAARFVRPELQERYVLTHGLLRQLLGKYLEIAPQSVTFTMNQHKKPTLAKEHQSTLQFNLSHSEDAVVIAITNGVAVGVDIEKIQAVPKLEVAERFFNPPEVAALKALAPAEQALLFYRLWAKKEAVVKADGKGFAVLHSTFSVSLADTPEIIMLEQQAWSLYTLNLIPHYAVAMAASKPVNILFHSQ